MPGVDGRGVTIALLDTGVDGAVPYLRGRIQEGIDVVGGNPGALAAARPDDPTLVERHGTQMAGLLVGGGGPDGLSGVATGASVLPIRVAGWQPDAFGHWAIYARSDQMIAGLDRAVDPNDDGDAHDAARVALIALAEPFAGFADGPEARAAAGALALDTLVVAPAGNDGRAGAGYGDIAAPGGSPAALTVGAVDTRTQTDRARIVVRAGLDDAARRHRVDRGRRSPGEPARPEGRSPARHARRQRSTAPRITDFFTRTGLSLVAGRAALVPMGASPAPAAARAAAAGASAVLLYGGHAPLPAGGLGLDESIGVPVVEVPAAAARAALDRACARPARCGRAARVDEHAELRAGTCRRLLVGGPRIRRPREAGSRRTGRRPRDVGPRRQRRRLAPLRHRQRLERSRRDCRGRRRAPRPGAARARRERALRPPDRQRPRGSRASP